MWSPDSTALAFNIVRQSHPNYGFYTQIHLVKVDGTYLHIFELGFGFVSAWLTNPSRLVYTIYNGTCGALYTRAIDSGPSHFLAGCELMGETGRLATNFVNFQSCSFHNSALGSVTWSPDRQKFALYLDHGAGCPLDIWVVNSDGTQPYQLVSSGFDPDWSHKTSQIAYVNGTNEHTQLCIIDLQQTNKYCTLDDSTYNRYPIWSPDDQEIAYIAKTYTNYEQLQLCVLRVGDMSKHCIISTSAGNLGVVDWRPMSSSEE